MSTFTLHGDEWLEDVEIWLETIFGKSGWTTGQHRIWVIVMAVLFAMKTGFCKKETLECAEGRKVVEWPENYEINCFLCSLFSPSLVFILVWLLLAGLLCEFQ